MRLDNNNCVFKSKNKVIRDADNLTRHVNKVFERVSLTKAMAYDNFQGSKLDMMYEELAAYEKLHKVRRISDLISYSRESTADKCIRFIDAMKQFPSGNCGESSFLAKIAAEINGIKNAKIASLYNKYVDMDHSVVYVDDKKPYIIDCWLGFADYVPNAIRRYLTEFRNFIVDENDEVLSKNMHFSVDNALSLFKDMKFSEQDVCKLKEKYPELVIKK